MRPVKIVLIMLVAAASLLCGAATPGSAVADCSLEGHSMMSVEEAKQNVARFFRQAAQGDAVAQNALGSMYTLGCGVPQNYQEAAKWIRLAAAQGLRLAQLSLGNMYGLGLGVPEDYIAGYAWTIIAVANDKPEFAVAEKQFFQQRMNSSQIAAAQQRAKVIQAEIEHNQQLAQIPKGQIPPASTAPSGSGSGFLVQGGCVCTCWHVVKDAKSIVVRYQQKDYPATVAASDAASDLAVLRLAGVSGGAPLRLAVATKLGDKVFTLGYPHPEMQGDAIKYTDGSISSLSGPGNSPLYYQISVPVQSGNSGGPLFNNQGELVGIVAAKLDAVKALARSGDLPQNVNYAVKADYLLPILKSIDGFPLAAAFAGWGNQGQAASPASTDTQGVVSGLQPYAVLITVY